MAVVDGDGVFLISPDNRDTLADIVFVHGLGAKSHSTWRHGKENQPGHFFWPADLADQLQDMAIWTVGYPTSFTCLGNPGTEIPSRAVNLALKLANYQIGTKPTVFVTHSLGGLIVKSLLVGSLLSPDQERKRLATNTRGIVFCGTPHRGSDFAIAAKKLAKYLKIKWQKHVRELEPHSLQLDVLHDSFIEFVRTNNVQIDSYAESRSIYQNNILFRIADLGLVVPRDSANPNIAGHTIKDIDKDHFNLVRPTDRSDDVYQGVLRFIKNVLTNNSQDETPTMPSNSASSYSDPRLRVVKSETVVESIDYRDCYRKIQEQFPEHTDPRKVCLSDRTCVVAAKSPSGEREILKLTAKEMLNRSATPISSIPEVVDDAEYIATNAGLFVRRRYISGITLADIVKSNTLGVKGALLRKWQLNLLQIIEKLQLIQDPVIHRDLHPGNIIVDRRTLNLSVIDCKSAVCLSRVDANVIGAPPFVSPEQLAGKPDLSSDIYSAGMVLIYLHSRKLPPSASERKISPYAEPIRTFMRYDPLDLPIDRMISMDSTQRIPNGREAIREMATISRLDGVLGTLDLGEGTEVIMRNLGFDLINPR